MPAQRVSAARTEPAWGWGLCGPKQAQGRLGMAARIQCTGYRVPEQGPPVAAPAWQQETHSASGEHIPPLPCPAVDPSVDPAPSLPPCPLPYLLPSLPLHSLLRPLPSPPLSPPPHPPPSPRLHALLHPLPSPPLSPPPHPPPSPRLHALLHPPPSPRLHALLHPPPSPRLHALLHPPPSPRLSPPPHPPPSLPLHALLHPLPCPPLDQSAHPLPSPRLSSPPYPPPSPLPLSLGQPAEVAKPRSGFPVPHHVHGAAAHSGCPGVSTSKEWYRTLLRTNVTIMLRWSQAQASQQGAFRTDAACRGGKTSEWAPCATQSAQSCSPPRKSRGVHLHGMAPYLPQDECQHREGMDPGQTQPTGSFQDSEGF
ncbi:uncharacterized protein LOC120759240 [Hirundo rustica]|uniref:uncharacterized protein LOC120759240 n=1 Tax=Hirundo rustica TaxID=43150 RepID=UPI001A94E9FA|nr:uncharacterized protein LOC120759240 [Hirundo rustica]